MSKYLVVGLGGFLGSVTRFWLGSWVAERVGTRFPIGTFLVNCTGCFLIGLILTVLDLRGELSPNWRYLLPIGFIGAYTTFSTFEIETLRSIEEGAVTVAALNVVLSVVIGFAAVWLGGVAGKAILHQPARAEKILQAEPQDFDGVAVSEEA